MKALSIASLFLLLMISACSEDDPVGITVVPDSEFAAVLAEAGHVVPLAPEQDEVTTTEETDNGFRYTYETHDAIDNLESVVYLGLNDDIVWPGNMVRGDQAHNFVYEPITAPRAPLTLSISLESSVIGGDLSETIAAPSLHAVRQGISDLVTRVFTTETHVPAQVDFSYQQVYSRSQMDLFVGVDISTGVASLSTAFDWSETSETNKIMAKYQQVYYSIDMDTPATPRALFADDITAGELRGALPAGSRPLYISSVKYGMMAIMCIETSYSEEQMELALDAAYSGAVDVDLGFGRTAHEVLTSSSIRMIVYGGSTSGIGEFTGYEDFMTIIQASTEFTPQSPGVPLVYKFRHVADNTLALITLTSQYTIVRPLRIQQEVRITSVQFVCDMSDDDDPFYDADVDMDDFKIYAEAYDRLNENDSGELTNPGNTTVFNWHSASYHEMTTGSIFAAQGSLNVTYDTEVCDWDCARLVLTASARDYDWASANETGVGSLTLHGDQIWGAHDIMIYNGDFTFRAQVTIEPLNK